MSEKSSKGKWKKLPEDVRRKAILDAALRCFSEKGYAATSVQDIANQAEMTKGGLYFHFESKADIQHALIESLTQIEHLSLESEDILALPPRERLQQQLTRYLDALTLPEGGLLLTLSESVTRCQTGLEEIRNFYESAGVILARTIIEGQNTGDFKGSLVPDRGATLLLTALDGMALHHELDCAGVPQCQGQEDLIRLLIAGFEN